MSTKSVAGSLAAASLSLLVASFTSTGFTAVARSSRLENPILFVRQTPVPYTFATIGDIFGNFTSFDPRDGQPVGGALLRLDPDSRVTDLTAKDNIAVRDPEISYDATRVVFAMKTGGRGKWQIFEMGVDGEGLRRLSKDTTHNDWDPVYLPNGRLAFISDRARWADGYENLPEGELYTMNGSGSNVRRLAMNPNGIFNPLPGSNGMIFFTQWDFHDCRDNIDQRNCELDVNRFLMWEIFADGSREGHPSFGMHTLFDFEGGYVGIRENPTKPGTYFAVLADEFYTFGAGAIVKMARRSDGDRDRPRFLTPEVFGVGPRNRKGRYRDPYPLAKGDLISSYATGPVFKRNRKDPVPDFNLVWVDAESGASQALYSDPDYWLLQRVEVAARTPVPLTAGTARPGFRYAIVNSKDISVRHRNCNQVRNGDCQPSLRPGKAVEMRLYEARRRPNYYREFRRYSDPRRRLLGVVPVQPDGSFAAAVPPNTPLVWEAVDATGKVLVQERFWSEIAAGEVRTCNGCHAPHRGGSLNRPNSALRQVTNLSGEDIDTDDNELADLVEALGLID